MKHRYLMLLPAAAILLIPLTAYADSSWGWLTETTPLTILPFAAAGTLVIEFFSIIKFGRVKRWLPAAAVIIAANLLSFAAPLFMNLIIINSEPGFGGFTLIDMINEGPYYIVSTFYLFLTIAIELPVVFYLLERGVKNKRSLLVSIIISNIITTILVAACQGLFAPGSW